MLENSVWLLIDKLSKICPGLLVWALVARYLGPELFGVWSYAVALTTIASTVSMLGMDKLAVKELVNHESRQQITVATVIFMRIVAAVVCMIACMLIVYVTKKAEPLYLLCTGFASFTILFQSFDVVDYFYQVKHDISRTILPKVTVFIIFCGIKAVVIWLDGGMMAFLWVSLLELPVTYGVVLLRYKKQAPLSSLLRASLPLSAQLLRQSWPLMFSSLVVVLFVKIDLLMLDYMSDPSELARYVAAARISELWYALPVVIATAVLPGLIRTREMSYAAYLLMVERWLRLSCWLSIAIAVAISIMAPVLIRVIYGVQYEAAASMLMIHIWACIPLFIMVVIVQYLFVEGKYKLFFYGNVTGLLANILINLVLIPAAGGVGAAITTVATYWITFMVYVSFDSSGQAWVLTKTMLQPGRLYADMKYIKAGVKVFRRRAQWL
ncbi:flippase [Chitinophaga vietnamensis]|uniref:flippase n=1 Tax=Chitinophaga vietnamensis TaxID=2593957 RepID=UPI001177D244|nr:flippase [Chitinophaga vietnamensis]